MPTEILAVGIDDADSDDVVIDAGSDLTVALKDDSGPSVSYGATVDVLIKSDNDEYFRIDTLTAYRPAIVITASGTYRFSRRNKAGKSCGVFSG